MRRSTLALAPILLVACTPLDRGLIQADGPEGSTIEVHARAYPVSVSAEEPWAERTRAAVLWLNAEASSPRPCAHSDGICVASFQWAQYVETGVGVVHVMDGQTAPDAGGYATLEWNDLGAILGAVVVVQDGYSRPRDLRHELGHAVLGLDDDPESVDLASIMAERNIMPDAHVTDHDFFEAQRAWDWTP